MLKWKQVAFGTSMLMTVLGVAGCKRGARETTNVALGVSQMARVGAIDERYQSYNVEMLEVTGGNSGSRTDRSWMRC